MLNDMAFLNSLTHSKLHLDKPQNLALRAVKCG